MIASDGSYRPAPRERHAAIAQWAVTTMNGTNQRTRLRRFSEAERLVESGLCALGRRNFALKALSHALEHRLKSLPAERFEQVVQRPDLKRRDRVLIVSGREDDFRFVTDALDDFEARRFRERDV